MEQVRKQTVDSARTRIAHVLVAGKAEERGVHLGTIEVGTIMVDGGDE